MNIDLDQEFQILMRIAMTKIQVKVSEGELTYEEAEQLTEMVQKVMDDPPAQDRGWTSSSVGC